MLVRLSTSLCWGGVFSHSGDEIELPDDVARKFIAAGSAEPIAAPIIETAALITNPPKGRRNERTTATR
jgi:hypothetical protein